LFRVRGWSGGSDRLVFARFATPGFGKQEGNKSWREVEVRPAEAVEGDGNVELVLLSSGPEHTKRASNTEPFGAHEN